MKTQLERVLLSNKPKVIISEDIFKKIQYLCMAISQVEWSGIALYSFEGSLQNPDSLVFTIQDIIPMNKGTSTYTSYQYNEPNRDNTGYEDKHIDYVNDKPEALYWRIAHVHSHQNMEVFFSGTDMQELDDNSAHHNMYLSVIVNNRMNIIANLAFRGKVTIDIEVPCIVEDENGNKFQIQNDKISGTKEKMFYYECDIVRPNVSQTLDDTFIKNVESIIKKANKELTSTHRNPVTTSSAPFPPAYKKEIEEEITETETDLIEDFVMNIFLAGDVDYDIYSCFENICMEIEATKTPSSQVTNSILENYWNIFSTYWEEDVTKENYIMITEFTIAFLEDYHISYPFTKRVTRAIERMLINFKESINASTNTTR